MKATSVLLHLVLAAIVMQAQPAVEVWVQRYQPGNVEYSDASAIVVDGSSDVIVAGYPATIKYSSAGFALWTNVNDIHVTGMVVDRNNNVIVTGNAGSLARDFWTIKYSSAGAPLWTNLYNGPGNGWDTASAVAVDSSNNVFITGPSTGIGSDEDYATIK